MMEIKGQVNTAVCFAKVIEDEAIEQIRRMCDYEFTAGSQIRIMPDVHAGKGCTIGTTMTVKDKAVPNIVGVDIGCGMYTVNLGKAEIDMEQMDAAARPFQKRSRLRRRQPRQRRGVHPADLDLSLQKNTTPYPKEWCFFRYGREIGLFRADGGIFSIKCANIFLKNSMRRGDASLSRHCPVQHGICD